MEKKSCVALLILISLILAVIFAFVFIKPEVVIEPNHDIYYVNDEFDDARTFTVMLNDIASETEHGAWATLQLSPSYSFGVRFNNISLPDNATLIDAYVELYSTGTPGLDHPNCKIYCDNVDNSVNFTDIGVLNISGRNYTNNFINWNSSVAYGKWVKTPSITAQVQEVISRENWTTNNSISILFITNGCKLFSATFQNFETGYPARLHIKWKE